MWRNYICICNFNWKVKCYYLIIYLCKDCAICYGIVEVEMGEMKWVCFVYCQNKKVLVKIKVNLYACFLYSAFIFTVEP